MHDQRANQPGIAEAHFGLGRMHVDVDFARIERDKQRQERMTVARQIVGVGRAHRADQELVADRAAVDEQILAERIGPRQRRQRGKSFDRDPVALGGDRDGVRPEIRAKDVAEPGEPPGRAGQRRGKAQRRTLLSGEREGDVGPAHGKPAHHFAHRFRLGAVELEKF